MSQASDSGKFRAPCRFLRSKEMYYETAGQEDEQFSSGVYWCTKTHEPLGPDGQNVGKDDCCAGRGCYVG